MPKKSPSQALAESTPPEVQHHQYLSLGCPLLNLAVSGDWRKGMVAGTFIFFAGDSASGKTLATLSQLAEAANNPEFDDHELWFINAEIGAFFDFERFFGRKAASRIQTMLPEPGKPMLLESVYDFIEAKIKSGKKIVAVIDSMDSLSTQQLEEHTEESAKARAQGKDTPGSYGDGKAKINSEQLKRIVAMINHSGSIVTMICQIRDNLKAGPYQPQKTRGGGHAIKYYASVEIWTTPGKRLTKTVNGKDRIIGIQPVFSIKKNRVNGRERTVNIPILPDVGMDSVGAAVDYLVDEKHWTVSGGRIVNTLYDKSYYREELIRKIEDDGRETELYDEMQKCWETVESALTTTRKKRWE